MTSAERHEARYQRRQAKRARNRLARSDAVGSIADVYTFRTAFRTGTRCCNGVRWKQSTQNFEAHLFSRSAKAVRTVRGGKWRPRKCVRFALSERGKTRVIDAPHIEDRHVHKVMSEQVLNPLYEPVRIADNGASQKGKGLRWQFDRLRRHLQRHFRKHGREGGVLLMDLKSFFPNANRELIYQRHAALIGDPALRDLADAMTRTAPESSPGRGMPLGLEVSQAEMVTLPTPVDQWIRCQRGISTMGHYMDDYYVILPDAEELAALRDEMTARFEALGIPVNRGKCRIVPLTKPFKFCKTRFTLTETGRVVRNRCRDGMKRARRKLKKFRTLVESGEMAMRQVDEYMESQLAYYREYDDHGRVLRLMRLRHALFEEDQ